MVTGMAVPLGVIVTGTMSDYRMWAPLFIVAWFLAGAIPSAAIVGILGKRAAFEKVTTR